MNLALTLQSAGRVLEAIDECEAALEVAPDHVPTMQAMARLLMERDRDDERLPELMEAIAMRGDAGWREWAARRLRK